VIGGFVVSGAAIGSSPIYGMVNICGEVTGGDSSPFGACGESAPVGIVSGADTTDVEIVGSDERC
jgi:hypothetical protein